MCFLSSVDFKKSRTNCPIHRFLSQEGQRSFQRISRNFRRKLKAFFRSVQASRFQAAIFPHETKRGDRKRQARPQAWRSLKNAEKHQNFFDFGFQSKQVLRSGRSTRHWNLCQHDQGITQRTGPESCGTKFNSKWDYRNFLSRSRLRSAVCHDESKI